MKRDTRVTCLCGKAKWRWVQDVYSSWLRCATCGYPPVPSAHFKSHNATPSILIYDRTNIDSICAAAMLYWHLKTANDIILTHHRFAWPDSILSYLLRNTDTPVYFAGTTLIGYGLEPMEKLHHAYKPKTINWFDSHPAIVELAKKRLPEYPLAHHTLSSTSLTVWNMLFGNKKPPQVIEDIDAYVRVEATTDALLRVECVKFIAPHPHCTEWLPLLEDWEGYKDIDNAYGPVVNNYSLLFDECLRTTTTLVFLRQIVGPSQQIPMGYTAYVCNSPILPYSQHVFAKKNDHALLSFYRRWDGKWVVQFYSYNPQIPCTLIAEKLGGFAGKEAGFAILDKWEIL